MKLAWKAFVGCGVLLIIVALSMDTTVSAGGLGRVHNLGLLSQQQTLLILGGFVFLAGIGLFGIVKLKQTPEDEARAREENAEKLAKSARETGFALGVVWSITRELVSILWEFWCHVRRWHVVVVSLLVAAALMLFPEYKRTTWDDTGVMIVSKVRQFVGHVNEPFPVSEIAMDLIVLVFWMLMALILVRRKKR